MGKANNWSRLQATAVASHLWASAQSAPGNFDVCGSTTLKVLGSNTIIHMLPK